MKLTEKYTAKTKEQFFDDFIGKISQYPFGGMPKRDLDCLIFFLLKKHGLIPGEMNRDRAYSLGISESKYKSLLVDSDAKFGGAHNIEESVQKIFGRLVGGGSGVSLEGDTLVFIEEDSVVKGDFAQAMKAAGLYTDTSFNSELIRVKAAGFLAFALERKYITEDEILALLLKDKSDEQYIETFKKSKKTGKDMICDVLDILADNGKFNLSTFFDIGKYIVGVIGAKLSDNTAKM